MSEHYNINEAFNVVTIQNLYDHHQHLFVIIEENVMRFSDLEYWAVRNQARTSGFIFPKTCQKLFNVHFETKHLLTYSVQTKKFT